MKRFYALFNENPIWARVILFDLSLLLIWIADGIVAFWAPVQIDNALKNTVVMGLIISVQSIAGFLADLLLPILLKHSSVRRLTLLGIIFVGIASLLLTAAFYKPFVILFLITMVVWGLYYEFISFASNQFMASSVPRHMRSGAWGITSVFSSSAYFLGPLIAPFLIERGPLLTEAVVLTFLFIAFLLFTFSKGLKEHPEDKNDLTKANTVGEFKHWWVLGKVIWPMVIMTLCLGFIDSSFWTIGAIWSEKLSEISPIGALFLPLYVLPAIGVGFIVFKESIYKGKKILSEKILILAGFCLLLMGANDSIGWQLLMVLLASTCLSVCGPLVQSVYSDIVSRIGHEKKEMIGLTNSIVNIAYIIWPPVIGFISLQIGERLSFSYMGLLVILTAIGLLSVTPKKLRLPQTEIKGWEEE
jgi:MFS family permease